jgi:hypothetical protein
MTGRAPARVRSRSKTTPRALDAIGLFCPHMTGRATASPHLARSVPSYEQWHGRVRSPGEASVWSQPASCLHLGSLDRMRPVIPDPASGHLDHLFHSLHAVRRFTWSTKQACSHTLPLFGLECMQCLCIFTLLKVHAMKEKLSAHKPPSLSLQCMCALLHSL